MWLTPLVGRENELHDVVQAVTRCRLLTLTGPGGAGKTRLALAAARSALASFPAGVCWVELAQIDDPGIVGQAVATRLGVPETPGQDTTDAVAEYVGEHQVLVVLDNCEHLAGATARLAEDLLAACPALTVLATSREALGVEGELNWQVPPLSLPQAGPRPTASALAASDAVKLFECDVTEFEDALLAARRARPAEAALPELQRAIGAYGGDFLDGMAAGEWALVRRDELRRAYESALLAAGRLQAAAGRHQAAAALFRRAVAHEPLNETAHRELMNSWVRLGETGRAVRHYEELVELLREQVGVPPAAETTALYQRLVTAP